MTSDDLSRFSLALESDDRKPLAHRINALLTSLDHCRNEDVDPKDDPAVRLCAAYIGDYARLHVDSVPSLVNACRVRVKDAQKTPSLINIMSHPIGYDSDRKAAFQKEAKHLLRRLASALNLAWSDYDLRYNAGGIAVSGEATLHSDECYIQVSQSCMRGSEVLYRRCHGRKDYTGERNHFASEADLCKPERFARRVHHELQLTTPAPAVDDTGQLFDAEHQAGGGHVE